ncbi:MAG: HEAT repeat domain-containing protein [Chitinispirillaceae bacterium]|nr:HEAT repeat domain-containing protein [Chitinispirillaceae bacterium]
MRQYAGFFCVVLLVLESFGVELRLRNGDRYKGVLSGEQEKEFILQSDSGELKIRKESVVAIDGKPYSFIPLSSNTVTGLRPLDESVQKKRTSAPIAANMIPDQRPWVVTLKNGTVIKGKPISQNQRLLVLETESSPITVFKNVITSIDSTGSGIRMAGAKKSDVDFTAPAKQSSSTASSSSEKSTRIAGRRSASAEKKRHRSGPIAPASIGSDENVGSDGSVAAPSGSTVTGTTVAVQTTKNEQGADAARVTDTRSANPVENRSSDTKVVGQRSAVKSRIQVMTLSGDAPISPDTAADNSAGRIPDSVSGKQSSEEASVVPSDSAPVDESISFIRPLRTPGMGVSRGKREPEQQPYEQPNPDTASFRYEVRKSSVASPGAPVIDKTVSLPSPLSPDSAGQQSMVTAPPRKTGSGDVPQASPRIRPSTDTADSEPVQKVPPLAATTVTSGTLRTKQVVRSGSSSSSAAAPVRGTGSTGQRVSPVPPMDRNTVPKKRAPRSDGKKELLLLDGTVFIGKILSENDRSFSLQVNGAALTILKNLVNTVDGEPLTSDSTEEKQVKYTQAQASRSGSTAAEKKLPPHGLFRALPNGVIPEGIAPETLSDSLTCTTDWRVRSRAARYIGAMGPWGVSMAPGVAQLLNDTAGSGVTVPVGIDSLSADRLLAPGLEAARALARLGTPGAKELYAACRNSTITVRRHAAFGTGYCFLEDAVKLTKEMLHDPDPSVRRVTLGSLRMNAASSHLIEACRDADPGVRAAAVMLLGRIGEPASIKRLVAMREDGNAEVRCSLAQALGCIGGAETVEPLTKLCRDSDPIVRTEAVRALGATKDTAAVVPLLDALKDPVRDVRAAAADAICLLRDSRAIPALYAAVKDREPLVRKKAENALRHHTDVSLLIEALDDPSLIVRANVSYMLWLLTGKDLGQDRGKWETWAKAEKKAGEKNATVKQ